MSGECVFDDDLFVERTRMRHHMLLQHLDIEPDQDVSYSDVLWLMMRAAEWSVADAKTHHPIHNSTEK